MINCVSLCFSISYEVILVYDILLKCVTTNEYHTLERTVKAKQTVVLKDRRKRESVKG